MPIGPLAVGTLAGVLGDSVPPAPTSYCEIVLIETGWLVASKFVA
jgi:hypothetical protein